MKYAEVAKKYMKENKQASVLDILNHVIKDNEQEITDLLNQLNGGNRG